MAFAERIERVRGAYERLWTDPLDSSMANFSESVVFHVAGAHPLSGDYVGADAVRWYLTEVTGSHGGFSVDSVFTDDTGDLVLVEGTAFNGGPEPFVRTIVHLLRFSAGRVVEFWDNPFDQSAEDLFWRAQVPISHARRGRLASPTGDSTTRVRPSFL